MSCNLRESFERSCRLCAEEQEVTIMIFSKEAEAMLLQDKINQYLLIEVNENDSLPKNICVRCCTKLHTVCDFIDTARKSQDILFGRSVLLSEMNMGESCEISIVKNETLDDEYLDRESNITEMEISIDPMLLLQSCEGSEITQDSEDSKTYGEEESYLHGLESENVTIKLIKKADQPETKSEESKIKSEGTEYYKPFPCIICKRSFFTELALKNHSWIHNNEDRDLKRYYCGICMETFDCKPDLLAHIKDHKSNVTCKICGRVFRSEENLIIHMDSHSSPSNAYVCKICGRAYNSNSGLKTHSITHSNERPYKCHLCKKCFKRNQDLKFHINQHTGARPYKCPYCEKSFASSGNCYSHRNRMHPGKKEAYITRKMISAKRRRPKSEERTQTNGRPSSPLLKMTAKGSAKFKCNICGHGFMRRDNYTYHMYQHTGEKPFQCMFCSEQFVTRRGLIIHHDRMHPTQDRPLSLLTSNLLLA